MQFIFQHSYVGKDMLLNTENIINYEQSGELWWAQQMILDSSHLPTTFHDAQSQFSNYVQ
jgi:hypothetical protein